VAVVVVVTLYKEIYKHIKAPACDEVLESPIMDEDLLHNTSSLDTYCRGDEGRRLGVFDDDGDEPDQDEVIEKGTCICYHLLD